MNYQENQHPFLRDNLEFYSFNSEENPYMVPNQRLRYTVQVEGTYEVYHLKALVTTEGLTEFYREPGVPQTIRCYVGDVLEMWDSEAIIRVGE